MGLCRNFTFKNLKLFIPPNPFVCGVTTYTNQINNSFKTRINIIPNNFKAAPHDKRKIRFLRKKAYKQIKRNLRSTTWKGFDFLSDEVLQVIKLVRSQGETDTSAVFVKPKLTEVTILSLSTSSKCSRI